MELTSAELGGVRRLVGSVCRRSSTRWFLRRLATACLFWAAVYLTAVLVSRLTGLIADVFEPVTVLAVPGLGLLSALLTFRRTPPQDGARLIDQNAQANDLFLTALRLQPGSGEFQPLVARQAEETAAKLNPSRIVPWVWDSRFGYVLASLAALLLIGGFTPQLDPFKKRAESERANERQRKLEESRQITAMQAQALEQKNSEANSKAVEQELKKLEETFRAARPELKERTRQDLSQRQMNMGKLFQQLSDEKLRDALSKSKMAQRFGAQSPERKKFRELAEEGKLSEIEKEMEAIKEKLNDLAKSPDSAERRKELDKLREKMQAMADALSETLGSDNLNEALSRALEQMDMSNMQDLAQEAMEAMQESMDLSQKELESLAKALQDMENLKQGMSAAQLAKALNEMGKLDGAGEGKGKGGMSEYEKRYREMMEQFGQGFAENGEGQGGTGGEGHGQGGKPPENPDAQTDFKSEASKSALQKGKILMNLKSKGSAEPGEAENAYREAIGALREAASEAILQEQVPPGYHDSIRDYFDNMEP